MKYLYKYPQEAYPYEELIRGNRGRSKSEPEYELVDTGIFASNRYFDVFVEYAKADVEDICIRITVANRGARPADLSLIPTLWFRNTWSWKPGSERPSMWAGAGAIRTKCGELGHYELSFEGKPQLLFTENETNFARLYGGTTHSPFVKDAFTPYLTENDESAVTPEHTGTKAGLHYRLSVPAHSEVV